MTDSEYFKLTSLIDEKFISEADPIDNGFKNEATFFKKPILKRLVACVCAIIAVSVIVLNVKLLSKRRVSVIPSSGGADLSSNQQTSPTQSTSQIPGTSKNPVLPSLESNAFLVKNSQAPSPFERGEIKGKGEAYEIDDVVLTFGFGSLKKVNDDDKRESYYENVEIYIENDNKKSIFIRKTDDIFSSAKYEFRTSIVSYDNVLYQKIIFNHIEEIKIPREIFANSSGWFWLLVKGVDTNNPSGEKVNVISTGAAYQVIDNKVIITQGDVVI